MLITFGGMSVKSEIVNACLKRQKDNLAAVLVFGSFRTGPYVEGVSDIDLAILYKRKIDFAREKFGIEKEVKRNLSIQQMATLEEAFARIYKEGSWSTWITILVGSEAMYRIKEFDVFKKRLAKPLDKERLLNYLIRKDGVELNGYFKDIKGWELAKGLFSHIRRKLQIISYYQGNKLEFDYDRCLNDSKVGDKGVLDKLSKIYFSRGKLTAQEEVLYRKIALRLTDEIKKLLS